MRKILSTTAAAMAMFGVVALAPAKAQIVFDAPSEAIGAGEAFVGGVTAPIVAPYGRAYVATYEPYAYSRGPVVLQCGLGIGCRYYRETYPAYWYGW